MRINSMLPIDSGELYLSLTLAHYCCTSALFGWLDKWPPLDLYLQRPGDCESITFLGIGQNTFASLTTTNRPHPSISCILATPLHRSFDTENVSRTWWMCKMCAVRMHTAYMIARTRSTRGMHVKVHLGTWQYAHIRTAATQFACCDWRENCNYY